MNAVEEYNTQNAAILSELRELTEKTEDLTYELDIATAKTALLYAQRARLTGKKSQEVLDSIRETQNAETRLRLAANDFAAELLGDTVPQHVLYAPIHEVESRVALPYKLNPLDFTKDLADLIAAGVELNNYRITLRVLYKDDYKYYIRSIIRDQNTNQSTEETEV